MYKQNYRDNKIKINAAYYCTFIYISVYSENTLSLPSEKNILSPSIKTQSSGNIPPIFSENILLPSSRKIREYRGSRSVRNFGNPDSDYMLSQPRGPQYESSSRENLNSRHTNVHKTWPPMSNKRGEAISGQSSCAGYWSPGLKVRYVT